jgi:nucleoside 2-deoxyribosyltransferase
MKVYLAGPDVFHSDAKERMYEMKADLKKVGLKGLSPLDNEIKTGYMDSPAVVSIAIYQGNINQLDEADIVIANIEPFRGPNMDPGTAFEIGYAVAKGLAVYAYTPHAKVPMVERVDCGMAEQSFEEYGQVTEEYRDENGMTVENFGGTENLMIMNGCRGVYQTFEAAVLAALLDQERKTKVAA